MSAADDLRRAESALREAEDALNAAAPRVREPYAGPVTMALLDVERVRRSLCNILKVQRAVVR